MVDYMFVMLFEFAIAAAGLVIAILLCRVGGAHYFCGIPLHWIRAIQMV